MEEAREAAEGEEELEEVPRKRRGKLIKILAIAIAAIVAGVGTWWVAFSNVPPVADFTFSAVDLRLTVSAETAYDPDGRLQAYTWDWGDGSPSESGIRRAHTYAEEGTYTVTLRVQDSHILAASASKAKSITIQVLPTATFIARHDRMTVSFDASASNSAFGGNIVAYEWDFGDGTTGTGVQVSHPYTQSPGANPYVVRLTVRDESGRVNSAERFVSPADTTIDIRVDEMFQAGCPYADYWQLRFAASGEQLLRTVTPCTYFYPWVLWENDPDVNPSWVYSQYRFDAKVRNHPGYNTSEPVILPVFNRSVAPAANSYVDVDLAVDYAGGTLLAQYNIPEGFGDGWATVVRGNLTMDLTMSKRIFGVPATADAAAAQVWWWNNTRGSQGPDRLTGPAEARLTTWLEQVGNGKYDIFNGFEWFYQPDYTDLNATVAADGTTTVTLVHAGWGFDALWMRWSYWGNASYQQAVNSPYGTVRPAGWAPMETCWCENVKIQAKLTPSGFDLDFRAVQTYSLMAWGNWGPDGIPNTPDDLPAWVFPPFLTDYVPRQGSGLPGASAYPSSELRWYEQYEFIHGTPGSFSYGRPYVVTVPPARWPLGVGSTLTLVLPKGNVAWYNPVNSSYNPTVGIGSYGTFLAPLTLRLIKADGQVVPSEPRTFFIWDARSKVISIAGPYDWGQTDLPLAPTPWIEFGPEAAG